MKKLFLFDIDGTIAIDTALIDGTIELIDYIRSIGGKDIYITNNSTKSRADYIEKFARWNIDTDESNFITAGYLTCEYLKEKYAGKRVYVVGTESFKRDLNRTGIILADGSETDISSVVVGFDNELTYGKIETASRLLFNPEVDFLASNPDLCCPTSFGSVPDCGAICKMLECAVKRKPEYIGKPNPLMVQKCIEMTGFAKSETLVIGDRLYTDIAVGINAGVDTALVLTGEATGEDVEKTVYKPTHCFNNVRELYDYIKKKAGI